MRLNDYNINQIIAQSRLKINYKEICKQNIKLYIFILVILSIIDKFFPFVNGILLSALLPILLKTSIEIVSLLIIKKQANKKLEIITEQLRENGLFINKMRLKRAELGTIRHKKIVECSGVLKEREEVTVFQDYNSQLKALRQIRCELTTIAPKDKNQYEYGNYTEIVENSEEAKRLYMKICEK